MLAKDPYSMIYQRPFNVLFRCRNAWQDAHSLRGPDSDAEFDAKSGKAFLSACSSIQSLCKSGPFAFSLMESLDAALEVNTGSSLFNRIVSGPLSRLLAAKARFRGACVGLIQGNLEKAMSAADEVPLEEEVRHCGETCIPSGTPLSTSRIPMSSGGSCMCCRTVCPPRLRKLLRRVLMRQPFAVLREANLPRFCRNIGLRSRVR